MPHLGRSWILLPQPFHPSPRFTQGQQMWVKVFRHLSHASSIQDWFFFAVQSLLMSQTKSLNVMSFLIPLKDSIPTRSWLPLWFTCFLHTPSLLSRWLLALFIASLSSFHCGPFAPGPFSFDLILSVSSSEAQSTFKKIYPHSEFFLHFLFMCFSLCMWSHMLWHTWGHQAAA